MPPNCRLTPWLQRARGSPEVRTLADEGPCVTPVTRVSLTLLSLLHRHRVGGVLLLGLGQFIQRRGYVCTGGGFHGND